MEPQIIEERKRKFLIVVPLIILPFITLLFYSLGGGKGMDTTDLHRSSALSATIPDPLFDETKPMDKMSLYQQAEKDSMEKLRESQYDPFAAWMPVDSTAPTITGESSGLAGKSPYSYSAATPTSPAGNVNQHSGKKKPEEAVEKKIAELERLLKAADTLPRVTASPLKEPTAPDTELQQFEAMIQSLSTGSPEQADPELRQMEGMLEKILDIQHPERVKDRVREQSEQHKGTIYAVTGSASNEVSDILLPSNYPIPSDTFYNRFRKTPVGINLLNRASSNSFYDDDDQPTGVNQNTISAVVHENQVLVSGATIKLRLQQNAYVQGQLIPKGSFVHGTCTLNGERLQIAITSLQYASSVYPVSMSAYGMDGLPGIRIQGSINQNAAQEGTDQALQTLSMGSLDPSIGAQATAAGIEAAKNLLSRKVKLIKVRVKADDPVLLVSDNAGN